MKLFKSLLVAPATLGLLAPIAATANEVTISDFTPAEQLAITNSRVDGLEARMNNIEAGSFSETTTATFGANFYAGIEYDDNNPAAGANDADDNLSTGYDFGIDLTTSFTGEDLLTVEIDAGESDSPGIIQFDSDHTGDALQVDEIFYTFPVGEKVTVMVGDNKDASSLFTRSCVYGGPSDILDACGTNSAFVDNGGSMVGLSYDFENGLTAAVGYAGNADDIMTEEGQDAYGANVAYTGDNYGVSFTYGALEDNAAVPQDNMGTDTYYGLNAYFDPDSDGLPSISAGYLIGEDDSVVGGNDGLSSFFAGLQWDEVGAGTLGVAVGTRIDTVEDTDAQYMYEAWYAYPLNDGMTITPVVFVQDISAANTDDTAGVMVRTSFSF